MKYVKTSFAIIAFILFPVFASCSKEGPSDAKDNDFVPIELTPTTRSFVEKGNGFGFKLLEQVAQQESDDFMISPLGVNLLLGIILEGAEGGEAMDEVCRMLGYDGGSREDVRNYCKTMTERLPGMDKLTKVSIANMVLTNSSFGKSNKSFESSLDNHYGTKVMNRSFSPVESLVKDVNSWAEKQTEGMIPEVLRNDDIDPAVISAVFLNALYFKGIWQEKVKFSKSMTSKEDFTTESGKSVKLDMMKKEIHDAGYSRSKAGGCLSLPYGNGAFAMNLYLPSEGVGLKDMLKHIALDDVRFERETVDADLWLPKFTCENKRIQLEAVLMSLGMVKAFKEDWLKLFDSGRKDGIGSFFQSTKISVDEEGTEAAAVTVALTKETAAMPSSHITFHCDRPFMYTITETSTGAILFAGVFRGK